jgi:general secretion pathway protein D
MIEVEVKSIELSESDMEELGFNWALSGIEGDKWSVYKGENTSSTGEKPMLKMLDSLLSGVDSQLIGNLNIFPDLFGSFKPFGIDESFNLTLTINALDRSDRTEQISAPRVLVANNKTATVKMTKAYYFPDEWEDLEFETEELGDNGDTKLDITPPRPEFADDPTDIGTIFTVTPTIIGKDTIRLHLIPDIKSYVGKDEHQVVIREQRRANANAKWEAPIDTVYTVWQPVISTRKLDVWIDVYHGETLVIGGLSDSSSQRRLDKIPILSDIPLIGRLFQNQSETSVRRNMLIFVTARMVGNDGIPRARKEGAGNYGIPRLMR